MFNIGGEAISGAVGAVFKRETGGRKAAIEAVGESVDDVAEAAVKSESRTVLNNKSGSNTLLEGTPNEIANMTS